MPKYQNADETFINISWLINHSESIRLNNFKIERRERGDLYANKREEYIRNDYNS